MIKSGRTNRRGTSQRDEQLNDGEVLYACPACGVVVSNHDPAAMRLHHLHVITPAHDDRAVEALRDRMEAERAEYDLYLERQAQFRDTPRFVPGSR